MFTHPDPIGQLAAEHHRHMLAEARRAGAASTARPPVIQDAGCRPEDHAPPGHSDHQGRRRGRRDPGRHLGSPPAPARRVSFRSLAIRPRPLTQGHARHNASP